MAIDITIPFYTFRLRLATGGALMTPLQDHRIARIQQQAAAIAEEYAEAFQKQVLNKGQLQDLLSALPKGDFLKAQISVAFPQAADQMSFPAFSLDFDYYYNLNEEGAAVWAIVPTIGLQVYIQKTELLEQQLREAITLDFARKRRLQSVQEIVSAIWYDSAELQRQEVSLKAPAPKDLEKLSKEQEDQLLPKAARLLSENLPACYEREKELGELARALKSSFQRNAIVVGPSGTGKTALVWELARRKAALKLKIEIWEATASGLIKELMRDTGWQDNLSLLCQELKGTHHVLFVRNLLDLFEVGKYEGNSISIGDYLTPYLSAGEITIIGECTTEELARIEMRSPGYLSHFQQIQLQEPSGNALNRIISQRAEEMVRGKPIQIAPDAIQESIRLNQRFSPYDGLPGRPIRFLENLLLLHQPQHTERKAAAGASAIDRTAVIRQFVEETGMPQFMVDPALPMAPKEVMQRFNNQVFGQEEAVNRITGVLATVKTALSRTGKPIASLLFVGPTGVGKTELAKQLASFMFGDTERMTRFDMSEFSTPYAVQRLTGISAAQEGLLTSAVRKNPFGLLLFDEIEKADASFFDLLLQVLSEGRLTDSQSKLVNFCSTIIIMTSNVGASNLNLNPIGWQQQLDDNSVKAHFINEVQKYFRPELFNRIDQVVPFAPLDPLTIRYVVEREIEALRKREGIRYRRMNLLISPEVYEHLAVKGYHRQYGARHLQRTLRQELLIPLARALNAEDPDDQLEVCASLEEGQVKVTAKADPLGLDLLLEEYTKIACTDHAGSLRRQVDQLREGNAFVRLLSEIDLMKQGRKRKGKAFWKDTEKANRYGQLTDMQAQVQVLWEALEQVELKFARSCLGILPYDPTWNDHLDELEQELYQQKIRLFATLKPEQNQCLMSIYGQAPSQALEFYRALFQYKGYSFTLSALWARWEARQLDIIATPLPSDISFAHILPEEKGDSLLGLRAHITGHGVLSYFSHESGKQRWSLNPDAPEDCIITADSVFAELPEGLGRRNLFTAFHPQRITTSNQFKDNYLGINREYQDLQQLLALVADELDSRFASEIQAFLL
ncbi:AAA family ATPase [Phaeodactylibacter luteus]|uniref:ATP-dependent Clp protease ATP-binding subunit n=1 Tax=Phaeodactylibacter luteus TaxID=1564516 RepID=A0A5C6RRG6_9BACT|nr:AAA family ATPase [Phaeodactylibacter luteus]TXB64878.1 ATP-dependent Clp protease ATP-binding subunit [Phaeodactylibacter luteus]